jgi:hypothetical protein
VRSAKRSEDALDGHAMGTELRPVIHVVPPLECRHEVGHRDPREAIGAARREIVHLGKGVRERPMPFWEMFLIQRVEGG